MFSRSRFLDDEEDVVQFITSRNSAFRRSSSTDSSVTLGRDASSDGSDDLFNDEIIDLTNIDPDITQSSHLKDGEFSLESYRHGPNDDLRRGHFIEVRNISLGNLAIEFVQIEVIAQDYHGSTTIRGIPYVRTRNLGGRLPKKLNEVCKILHIHKGGSSIESQVILVDVSPHYILAKRNLIITNAQYPLHSFQSLGFPKLLDRERRFAEQDGSLCCRWKFEIYFKVHGQSQRTKPEEEVIERIQFDEVGDPKFRISDETMCNQWRGGKVRGGSWLPGESMSVNVEDNTSAQLVRKPGQKYTLFDSFSGAGGVSRGAQMAEFKPQYAVDKWEDVWRTYAENFGDTELFRTSVDGFIRATRDRQIRVDVLHLSPPCQYFSPAHTHESVHDDENIFALFGCNQLINKVRPRLITLEQTFGITHERHHHYLRALIGDYTQFGYSVRWKVVRLCTWGLAQDRKRLIVIAAAPGDKLPPFPEPTHSQNGEDGLKPFTTIRRAIGDIRHGDNLHDIQAVKHYYPRRPPLDQDRLAGTITTGGSEAYYPDGTRDFTLREYAALQGFPWNHKFIGTRTCIKKQIGNAFPPNTVRVLYKHLENWLLNQDGMTRDYHTRHAAVVVEDEIVSDRSTSGNTSSGLGSSPETEDVMDIDDPGDHPGSYRGRNRVEVIDLT